MKIESAEERGRVMSTKDQAGALRKRMFEDDIKIRIMRHCRVTRTDALIRDPTSRV